MGKRIRHVKVRTAAMVSQDRVREVVRRQVSLHET
jgi:hypothetical protein